MPNFPEVDRIPLRQGPLEFVVCQMRFPPPLALASDDPPLEFGTRLRDRYPVTKGTRRVDRQGDPDRAESSVWLFEDRESAWTVTLSSEFLSLETSRYTTREEFLGRFMDVTHVLTDLYPIPLCERLGLRYLNRVADGGNLPKDWLNRLPPQLLPALQSRTEGESCSATTEVRFHGVANGLALRVGFVDRGFAGAEETELLLDFDSYTVGRTEFNQSERILNELSSLCYNSFRWAMGDLVQHFTQQV